MFAIRERLRRWLRSPAGASVVGAAATAGVLALIGPFGTYESLGPGARLLYWLATIGAVWVLMELTLRVLAPRMADRLPAPQISVPLLAAALMLVPATAVVWGATRIALPGAGDPVELLWKVGLLMAVIALLFVRVSPGRAGSLHSPTGASAARARGPERSSFFQRIPARLRGDLLCLEQEDHYLRIHTTDGSDLIHCRMADAERELGPAYGLRVHRSWWVVRGAVRGVERQGGRSLLRLADGRKVPIGKTYRPRLKQAGWL